jgi:hypothetical protein
VERTLGGVLLRHRIAEVSERLTSPTLCEHPAMAGNDGANVAAIGIDEDAQLFRIARKAASFRREKLGGESGDVAPFGSDRSGLGWGRGRFRLPQRGRLRLLHTGGEFVAAVRDGDDKDWALRVRFDLPAQTDDLHIDAAVVDLGVASGQKLQQLIAG